MFILGEMKATNYNILSCTCIYVMTNTCIVFHQVSILDNVYLYDEKHFVSVIKSVYLSVCLSVINRLVQSQKQAKGLKFWI